jgi:hypothetical protein
MMPARKRSRTKRVKTKRLASDPWTHPKVEIAFRDINDGRKLFNMLPYTREDMPPGVLRDRLKVLDDSEQWLKRKRKAQEAKKPAIMDHLRPKQTA